MPPSAVPYRVTGVSVAIDRKAVVKLPARLWRGRLIGLLFETDKCFLLPSAIPGVQEIKRFYDEHPGLQVLVVGHADRAGDADYNRTLSRERADAVCAFLSDRVDAWLAWYGTAAPPSKRWGVREDQHMLSALADGAGKFYAGKPTGVPDAATQAATRRFQAWSNQTRGTALAVDGVCGPLTRRELCTVYMQQDGTTLPKDTVLAAHGCGEFHPELPTPDGVASERNRRVEIFLFEDRIDPPPQERCPDGGCPEYPIWVARAVETVDVRDRPEPDARLAAGRLPGRCGRGRSFPKPATLPMLRQVARRAAGQPGLRILVVGHTDQSGADATDAQLSRARAEAVAALLAGDAGYFRQRFRDRDPTTGWGWEELQWMLSAIEVDGDPCYAGQVDGHCGPVTLHALEQFQVARALETRRHCDEATLVALIAAYLERIGPDRPRAGQIEVVGGGSWHPPRELGGDAHPLTGPEWDGPKRPARRRTELFLADEPFAPAPSACPPGRHDSCAAYRSWCEAVEEQLDCSGEPELAVRLLDHLGRAVAGRSIALASLAPDGSERPLGAATTGPAGVARLSAPAGLCSLRHPGGRADLVVDPEQLGGVTIRVPQ